MAAIKINFTKAALGALTIPPPGKRAEVYDSKTPRLMLRVTHTGAKSFAVYRRVNGRPQRVRLGCYPDMTIEQARKAAAKALSKMANGIDPIAEKRAKLGRAISLQAVLDAYTESHDLKPGTVKDYRLAVKESSDDWLNKPLVSITKDMVERRHRERGKQSKARANNAMRVLRALFNYAVAKYEDADGNPLITVNPVTRLSAVRAWYRVPRRQTVIKNHQLPAWFDAVMGLKAERDGRGELVRDYFLTVLFTGLRKQEAARLQWADVDFKDRSFTVTDTKNRDPHCLPLPDFLHELHSKRLETAVSGYVFAGLESGGVDIRYWIRRITETSGVKFTTHDLRRVFTTTAESLDISLHALKRLLNHRISQSDVTAGYIITDVERLRVPMRKIENRLLHVASRKPDAKVVTLAQA